jgi:hypothetical protein
MFRSIYTTIFRGLKSSTLCFYQVEFRGCTFVMFLYSVQPYVIIVGFVCVCVCVRAWSSSPGEIWS